MGMALIGAIIVWCTFPILLLSTTYNSSTGVIVSMSGQINMWQALSSSVLGVFACSSLYFERLSVHELVFTSLSVRYL